MSLLASNPTMISIRRRLRAAVDGRIITPGNPAYDQARTVFYGGIDRRPAVIVRPTDASDVSQVVSLARETGLELAVRSGGHSLAGHSTTDGGIVLDLADMHALEIDPQQRTAWAETGLTAGEYTTAAGAYGLATGFGDTGSVGIGGITLGGGIGYLVRKHGLTIDQLLAAELVTADGQLLHVDDQSHPELFWAIRGGGGNFGVATRFQFRLQEVSTIVGGLLLLPATPEVIAGFIALADAAPEGLSTIANVMPAPPLPFLPAEQHGRLVIMATLAYAGDPEAGQRAVAPLRALATPLADLVRPMPYPEIYPPEEEGEEPTTRPRWATTCSSTPSTAPGPKRSSSTWGPRPRQCGWRSCGCWAGQWPACPPTPPRSPTEQVGSWCTWPRSTSVPRTPTNTRPGSTASPRRCKKGRTRAPTSTSSATRARRGSTTPTRGRPGSGWRRSRLATTRPTCSTSTRTSPPPQVTPTARSRLHGTGTSEPGSYTAVHRRATDPRERRPT